MKRLFSSVFIVLIFLNVMGYYGVLLGLKYKNTLDLTRKINDGSYNESETGTFKIPFKDPNGIYADVFERVDGDFEQDGEIYRLIKQRLYRDTFHIVYIKDKTGTALNNAIADYVKTFSDTAGDDGKQSTILPFFIKEYFVRTFTIQQKNHGWELAIRRETHPQVFIDDFTPSVVHPPERA